MTQRLGLCFLGLLTVITGADASAQTPPVAPGFAVTANNGSFADIADLVVISPLIVDATVRKITKIPPNRPSACRQIFSVC